MVTRYELEKRAAYLRANNTKAEARAFELLDSLPCFYKQQYIIFPFIADIICGAHSLVIELDGTHHLSDPQQQHQDRKRTHVLKTRGWTVRRFSNASIWRDPDWFLSVVRNHCSPTKLPPSEGCSDATSWLDDDADFRRHLANI